MKDNERLMFLRKRIKKELQEIDQNLEVDVKNIRIGNYLEFYKSPVAVNGIVQNQDSKVWFINDFNVNFFNPIQITLPWLDVFDFEWCKEAVGFFDNNHAVYLLDDGVEFHPFCTNDKDCWIKIKYVHELQNLCFALTGIELEIKTK